MINALSFCSHSKEFNDPQLPVQTGYNKVDNEAVKSGGLVKTIGNEVLRSFRGAM